MGNVQEKARENVPGREHSRKQVGKIIPQFLRGRARAHIENNEDAQGSEWTYTQVDKYLRWLFKQSDLHARAAVQLCDHKQLEDKGVADFMSAMQHLAQKAYPQAPAIANENIVERLVKGLKSEWLRNYMKMQLVSRPTITIDELEEELCKMEESTTDMNQNVLLDDRKDSQEPKLVLSMEEWNERRAASLHQQLQMQADSEPTVQAKLPLLGPAERAQMEWTHQLDALAKVAQVS